MGSDAITLPTLKFLWSERERVRMAALYTQPDKARGRGKKIQANAVKTWALEQGIPVRQPERFGEGEIEELRRLKPEIMLVMAYGQLLPQAVLDTPPLGIYNLHTSLLPELRGASPIETAVASGMTESGVSLMRLIRKMDAGPVCDQERLAIAPLETGGGYREKLAQASPRLLNRNFDRLLDGSIELIPQSEETASYCRLLVKQDGQLDFKQPASALSYRINGLNPWPGCFAALEGTVLKFELSTWLDDSRSHEPGMVVGANSEGVLVGTGRGLLQILALQKPGGKLLSADVFLRGYPIDPGFHFISQEMHPLVSRKPVSHKRVFQLYAKP